MAALVAPPPAWAATFVRSDAFEARRGIDVSCDLAQFDRRAEVVQIARVRDERGVGPWRLASVASMQPYELLERGRSTLDYADVFTRAGTIVYASFRSSAPGGSGDYCYVHGRLARASFDEIDGTTDRALSRKRYYDPHGSLFADTGTVIADAHDYRKPVVAATPSSALAIDFPTYATPRDLPFYAAYRAARARSLPVLR